MTPKQPSYNQLILRKMAFDAVSPGGGVGAAMDHLQRMMTDENYRKSCWEKAANWVNEAIEVFKTAPDNPYGDDKEAIATAILLELKERSEDWS